MPSVDIGNCELLTDAMLLREEIQHSRDGCNRYKVFCLTDKGKEVAEQLKAKGFKGEEPKNPLMD